jgi:hypothetical protein
VGIIVALCTLRLIQSQTGHIARQATTMEKQLVVAYRAYLAAGEPEQTETGQTKFPLLNYRQIAAEIKSVQVIVRIQKTIESKPLYERTMTEKSDSLVIPTKEQPYFALFVTLPKEFTQGDTLVHIKITYDTGFESTDTLNFLRVLHIRDLQWRKAWEGIGISFQPESDS